MLRDRGETFYHGMTTMDDGGEADHDPTRSGLGEKTRAAGAEAT
ncbi:hypothetical protein GCM10028784_17040 [Myceligenerans cantabricum]